MSLGSLEVFEDGQTVTPELLREHGLVRSLSLPIKVLGNGTISRKLTVALHAFTATARAAIEEAGGKVEVI